MILPHVVFWKGKNKSLFWDPLGCMPITKDNVMKLMSPYRLDFKYKKLPLSDGHNH